MPQRELYAPEQRPRRNRKKTISKIFNMRILLLIMVILIAAGLLVLVFNALFGNRGMTIVTRETTMSEGFTMLNTGSGMLYHDGRNLGYFDWSREKLAYSYKAEGSGISMNGSEGITVVYNSSVLQIVDRTAANIEQSPRVPFTGTIISAECGISHIAVLVKGVSGAESLVVLNGQGGQVDQIASSDSYIVNFGFFNNSANAEMLWVQSLNTSAGTPTTSITTYTLTASSAVSSGIIQLQDQLVDRIYFTNKSIFLVGTSQLIRYDIDRYEESWRELIYGYRVMDFSGGSSTASFMLGPRSGDMNAVLLLTVAESSASSAVFMHMQLPSEGVAGFIMNAGTVVVAGDKSYVYNSKGKLTETVSHEGLTVQNAIKINDSLLLLLSEGRYYTARYE